MELVTNNWKLIKTEEEYNKALDKLELIFDAVQGSAEFDEVELLGLLIKDYEDKHYPISLPDPLEAVKIKMEELGLESKDLKQILGNEEQVKAVLNGKEELTLKTAQNLHYWLNIPSDVFMDSGNITSNLSIVETYNATSKKDRINKLKQLSLKLK